MCTGQRSGWPSTRCPMQTLSLLGVTRPDKPALLLPSPHRCLSARPHQWRHSADRLHSPSKASCLWPSGEGSGSRRLVGTRAGRPQRGSLPHRPTLGSMSTPWDREGRVEHLGHKTRTWWALLTESRSQVPFKGAFSGFSDLGRGRDIFRCLLYTYKDSSRRR